LRVSAQLHDRNVGCPHLPSGQFVGTYTTEGGKRIWTRHIDPQRHLLRIRNSWTVNAPVLDQLAEDDVYLIRYVTPAEIYEVPLSEFMRQSEKLEHFACGEDTFALPRGYWTTSSGARNHTLPLFSDTET